MKTLMKTTRCVNIKKSGYDVYMGRAGYNAKRFIDSEGVVTPDGYFGNPYYLSDNEPRGATIQKFKAYFYNRLDNDPVFKRRVHELAGLRLGCFCKPYPCHVDVYVEYLNSLNGLNSPNAITEGEQNVS
jgi:hypothetical protein